MCGFMPLQLWRSCFHCRELDSFLTAYVDISRNDAKADSEGELSCFRWQQAALVRLATSGKTRLLFAWPLLRPRGKTVTSLLSHSNHNAFHARSDTRHASRSAISWEYFVDSFFLGICQTRWC